MSAPVGISQNAQHEFQVHNLERNDAVWLQVENFDLYIKRTDEGIVIDVYDVDDEERSDPLGSTYVFDSETTSFNPDIEV